MSTEIETPKAKGKRRRKSTLDELAEAGDIEGLCQVICASYWALMDLETALRCLYRAIDVVIARDPLKFSQLVLRRMIALSSCLLFRVQIQIARSLRDQDATLETNMSRGDYDKMLDQGSFAVLAELQRHVAELILLEANANRLWELTREKKRKNENWIQIPPIPDFGNQPLDMTPFPLTEAPGARMVGNLTDSDGNNFDPANAQEQHRENGSRTPCAAASSQPRSGEPHDEAPGSETRPVKAVAKNPTQNDGKRPVLGEPGQLLNPNGRQSPGFDPALFQGPQWIAETMRDLPRLLESLGISGTSSGVPSTPP